ncbi:sulfite exporter TauE/SafE family protein [Nostoc sp. FACHB-87]|uniref:sulfite exporter TauE/SafE family protein n=1 Tax=Nostocaceae TaxID=1162 RepID=UPI0016830C8A|nr:MULTISPECIES: sulfite exporter TauE/SafE family protein [Nostocaceae]MBD2457508.1 sulfite exporter TauE/SafE family protein [Nostoc sp. FACHB-87]MBD2478498.1 sulfite exporter TauE/SafE family protein [Anabaena sp. FACHB-83]
MTWIIGHILAACIGLSLGLIGGGGSVLALPVLVYVMGIPTKSAIAMTLAIVGTVSLLGIIPHWRAKNIQLKTALIFGSATMLGTFIGAKIALLPFVTETFQMLLFGIMMLLAAVFMIRRSSQKVAPDDQLALYPPPVCQYCWLWLMTEGLGVGILTGLIGVGGGFAIVPALVLLGKVPMKKAIGTSLLIIVFNSIAGFLSYWGHISFNWQLMLSFIVAASGGTIFGAYLAEFVPAHRLQKSFGYFLLAVAALVLFQNRHSFQSSKVSEYTPNIRDRLYVSANKNHDTNTI